MYNNNRTNPFQGISIDETLAIDIEQTHVACRMFKAILLIALLSSAFSDALVAQEKTSTDLETVAAKSTTNLPVKVEVTGIEDELLQNVLGYLPIYPFNNNPAPSHARLRYLHNAADETVKSALRPFGYYQVEVKKELLQQDSSWVATYDVTPGERIPVGNIDVQLIGPGAMDPEFLAAIKDSPLQAGKPFLHSDYEELKKQFQVLASQRGYFDAKLLENQVLVNLPQYKAHIKLHFETGERYKLGKVNFIQDKPWLNEAFLNKYVEIDEGQDFESSDLQQLQGDLSNTEYYSQVELGVSPENAENLVIPVDVNMVAKKPHKYIFGVGYGTDTGVRTKLGINGRRFNSSGHHYNAEILLSQIKYGIAGEYIIPGNDPRSDAYGIRASYEDEHSNNRNYQAVNLGGYYKYRDLLWMKTWALNYRIEKYELANESETSSLLIPSVDWTRTYPPEMEKRIYATSGTWLQLRLRGGHESFLSDTTFVQPLLSAKWIHSFANSSRIITRGSLGTTWVDDWDKIPTSLRYFSGGDKSIRGYEYGVVAPSIDGDVVGGKNLTEASFEYEYPIAEKWSIAAFTDIGDAFDDKPDYKTGVGIGLHWVSPIGPVRIDLGHGVNDPPGNKLRLHLTIGPDL